MLSLSRNTELIISYCSRVEQMEWLSRLSRISTCAFLGLNHCITFCFLLFGSFVLKQIH